MTLLSHLRAGARMGALLGATVFLADLGAAFAAAGDEFHASPAGFALLALLGAVAVAAGALAGLPAGLLVGAGRRSRPAGAPGGRMLRLGLLGAGILVFAGSYLARRDGGGGGGGDRPGPPIPVAGRPVPVLLVVIDTLRVDTLYGENLDFPLAPAIGALARRSLVFREAEAPSGWTIPSTASLLTGVYPTTLGAERGLLPHWAPTVAETLRAAGYRTHAVVDNALLGRRNGFAAGFETYSRRSALEFAWGLLPRRLLSEGILSWLSFTLPVSYCGADVVTDEALKIIDSAGDEPFFLYVHYMDVHTPFRDHPELGTAPAEAEETPLRSLGFRKRIRHDRRALRDGQLARMEFLYRNELRWVDRHLGRLLTRFDQRFGVENTLVVLTADHGEEFYEHGSFGHGYTLYSELVHVPLLVRLPEAALSPERASGVIDGPVSLVDVVPTALDVLGIDGASPERTVVLQGRSLLPLVRGDDGGSAVPLFGAQNRFGRRLHRWRRGDDVYVTTSQGGAEETVELFDLGRDRGETRNRAESEPARAREMARELAEFLARQLAARDPERVTTETNLDALEALGYGGK